MAKRVFISFDYDHDADLRIMLIGQAKNPDSPFEIADWSVKEAFTGDWEKKVRQRIRQTELTVVICGTSTHTATGVASELSITQDEKHAYFLLEGRANKTCTKPTTAKATDKLYSWTWDNLKSLIGGAR